MFVLIDLSRGVSALQVARDLGDEAYQALCLNAIGSIHLDKGEYQDALTYLEQAYDLRQKMSVPEDLAVIGFDDVPPIIHSRVAHARSDRARAA